MSIIITVMMMRKQINCDVLCLDGLKEHKTNLSVVIWTRNFIMPSEQPGHVVALNVLDITELMEFHPGTMMTCVAILLLPIGQQAKCLSVVTNITRKPLKWRAEATHMTQTHCTGSTQQTHNNRHTTDTQQQLCSGKPPMATWKLRK